MSRRRRYYSSMTRLTTDFLMLIFNFGLAAIAGILMLIKELVNSIIILVQDNKKRKKIDKSKNNGDMDKPPSPNNINITINENINVVLNQSVNFNINTAADVKSHTPDIILSDNQYTLLDDIACRDELKEEDTMLPKAVKVVLESGMASTSMLQRKLKIGYARAARLIDIMEEKGIIGPYQGAKPREVLIAQKTEV